MCKKVQLIRLILHLQSGIFPLCVLSKTQIYIITSKREFPSVPVSKPSKSPALIPIFLPKTSIRRIALLLLLPLGANLFLQRWKLSAPTKLLTHSQWRCQFSRPRYCGVDNLIGEAQRCVPGRRIQMLYHRLSQFWLLSCCTDSRFNSPPPLPSSHPFLLVQMGATQAQAPERTLCRYSDDAPKFQRRCVGEVQGEDGESVLPSPGSRLAGKHKISQQIMKLSLIAQDGECWRVSDAWRSLLYRGPLQGMRSMSLEERLLSTDALFL